MRGEKEKSIEEKKLAFAAKCFYGHAYSPDLIEHIFIERVNREEKSTLIGQIGHIFTKINEKKKDKTVSFQSTSRESMFKRKIKS